MRPCAKQTYCRDETDLIEQVRSSDFVATSTFRLKIVEKSLDLLKQSGLQPWNIDFVVVCEQPKIAPYVDDLKRSLSSILNIEESFIGVKATTTEKMGVIGNGNGIAVFAIASLGNL